MSWTLDNILLLPDVGIVCYILCTYKLVWTEWCKIGNFHRKSIFLQQVLIYHSGADMIHNRIYLGYFIHIFTFIQTGKYRGYIRKRFLKVEMLWLLLNINIKFKCGGCCRCLIVYDPMRFYNFFWELWNIFDCRRLFIFKRSLRFCENESKTLNMIFGISLAHKQDLGLKSPILVVWHIPWTGGYMGCA